MRVSARSRSRPQDRDARHVEVSRQRLHLVPELLELDVHAEARGAELGRRDGGRRRLFALRRIPSAAPRSSRYCLRRRLRRSIEHRVRGVVVERAADGGEERRDEQRGALHARRARRMRGCSEVERGAALRLADRRRSSVERAQPKSASSMARASPSPAPAPSASAASHCPSRAAGGIKGMTLAAVSASSPASAASKLSADVPRPARRAAPAHAPTSTPSKACLRRNFSSVAEPTLAAGRTLVALSGRLMQTRITSSSRSELAAESGGVRDAAQLFPTRAVALSRVSTRYEAAAEGGHVRSVVMQTNPATEAAKATLQNAPRLCRSKASRLSTPDPALRAIGQAAVRGAPACATPRSSSRPSQRQRRRSPTIMSLARAIEYGDLTSRKYAIRRSPPRRRPRPVVGAQHARVPRRERREPDFESVKP